MKQIVVICLIVCVAVCQSGTVEKTNTRGYFHGGSANRPVSTAVVTTGLSGGTAGSLLGVLNHAAQSIGTFSHGSGHGQSGFGQSGFGQSGFGQSGFGQGGFSQSGFGQSGLGQSSYTQSGLNQGGYNQGGQGGQGGYNQGGQGGYNQGSQAGYNQGSQGGFNQGGLIQGTSNQGYGSQQTCKYWCRTPLNKYYCCEGSNQQTNRPIVKPGTCPAVRPMCPPVRNFAPPQQCSSDSSCTGTLKCCFDKCLQHHTCKPPNRYGW